MYLRLAPVLAKIHTFYVRIWRKIIVSRQNSGEKPYFFASTNRSARRRRHGTVDETRHLAYDDLYEREGQCHPHHF